MTTNQATKTRTTNYQNPFRRMLYDSPLHSTAGKIGFALIMAIIIYMAADIWINWLTPLSNSWIVLGGIFAAFVGSLIGLAFLRYLDRREPESWWYWIGALLFALIFTVAPAAYINRISPVSTLTVGFNEEFWKVMPLLLLVFFAPTTVNGVRDGILYGALGGFAFNIVEISNYFLRVSYPERGIAGLSDQLARLSFWGIGNHVIWSMLVGAGIGLAVQSKRRRTKILAPLGAYLLAVVTHDIQDMGGGVILTMAATAIVMLLQGVSITGLDPETAQDLARGNMGATMQIEAVLINIIILPLVIYALVKSGNWERKVVRDELADEVGTVITAEEYEGVRAEKRFRLRRVPGYSRGVARKIRNAQNGLAFTKSYLKRKNRPVEADPLVAYYQAEVVRLRSATQATS
jgi:RsiW-degrading membrane proteinase PrsW (M82 family)